MLRALSGIMAKDKTPRLNFWKSVDRSAPSDCWEWSGDVDIVSGFGVSPNIVSGSEVVRRAHRLAYILTYGGVPANHVIRHTCRNRLCCNPKHLIPMRMHPEDEDEHFVTAYYYSSKRAPRLSEFEKRKIVMLRSDGVSITSIAERFKVSRSTVSRVLKGGR